MVDVKELWKKYDSIVAYNNNFRPNKNYYESIKVWNDFYNGDQWGGATAEQHLPQMVFNIIKRIVEFKIASLTSSEISVNVEPLEYNPTSVDENGKEIISVSDFVNAEIKNVFEKWNMRARKKDVLLDGAITGDMCFHVIFNMNKQPYRGKAPNVKGEMELELIDATNIGFGNANIKDVQKQPYIVIVGRDTVKNLREEAKNKKELIKEDNETNYQVSDFANTEVEINGDNEGKALYIYVYEKKGDKVFVSKCTKDAIIYENIDTGLSRYPIAFANWYKQKGTYHGRGEIEGICPNQIAINKMFSMIVYHQMMTAFPTAVYDADIIKNWSNKIGTAFGLRGLNGRSIKEVAGYLNPANMSEYIIKVIDLAFQYTKECLGVSDASLGQIDPKNTSAIIAVQKSTSVPLENIKDNLYDLFEQTVLIMLDMMSAKYGERPVVISKEDGTRVINPFNFEQLKGLDLKTSVDVGETTYYSEIASIQTLDNLLQNQYIEFIDYLERMPKEMIPRKAELVTKLKENQQQIFNKDFMYEMMAQFLEQLPPEKQAQIKSLPPEQMEKTLMKMMMGGVRV